LHLPTKINCVTSKKSSNLYFIVTIVKPENITYIRESIIWAVHVARMEERREAETILVRKSLLEEEFRCLNCNGLSSNESQSKFRRQLPASWWFMAWSRPNLRPWRWRLYVPPNIRRLSPDYTVLLAEDKALFNYCCENLQSSFMQGTVWET
jgi:hypothetical protein